MNMLWGARALRLWPVRMCKAGAILTMAICTTALWGSMAVAAAQDGRREVEAGNRLYEEGRFQEAHARYLDALRKVPDLPLARFNEGNALYRSQEFQRAMEAFLEAAEGADPEWRASALYNLGNALMRQEQGGPAAEAYKEALRLDPADRDAKHNLELALQLLEQQERQEQQGGEDNNPEEDNSDENRENRASQQQNPEGAPQNQEEEGENDPGEGEGGAPQPRPQPDASEGEAEQDRQSEAEQDGSPPQMTPEQAERLLQAVTEDPGEVNRQAAPARGRRPRKDW